MNEGGSQSQDDNDRVSNLNKEMLNDKALFKKLKSNIAARSKLTLYMRLEPIIMGMISLTQNYASRNSLIFWKINFARG